MINGNIISAIIIIMQTAIKNVLVIFRGNCIPLKKLLSLINYFSRVCVI